MLVLLLNKIGRKIFFKFFTKNQMNSIFKNIACEARKFIVKCLEREKLK